MTQAAVSAPEDDETRPSPVSKDGAVETAADPTTVSDATADALADDTADPQAAGDEPEPTSTDTVQLVVVQSSGFPRYFTMPNADGSQVLRLGPDPVDVDASAADDIITAGASMGMTIVRLGGDNDEQNGEAQA